MKAVVDVASVADRDHEDLEPLVDRPVHDAPVPGAPRAQPLQGELERLPSQRVVPKDLDRRPHPRSHLRVEETNGLRRRRGVA